MIMFTHPCFSAVFTLLICSISILAGPTCEPKHVCDHDQNTMVFRNCSFSNCRDCPTCHIGMGLKEECNKAIFIGSSIECVDCINGKTYNDVDAERIVSCKSCNFEEHRKVIYPCNRTHNTRYADDCDAGYWFSKHPTLGPCIKCSCCNNDKDQVERRCLEVGGNVPVNTSCICPVGNVDSTQQSRTNDRTVSTPSSTSTETEPAAPKDPINMSRSITLSTFEITGSRSSTTHVSNWKLLLAITTGVTIIIIALIIVSICVVIHYCKKKNATGGNGSVQSNSEGYQLTGVTLNDGSIEADVGRGVCMLCCPWRDAQSSDSVEQLLSGKQPKINNVQLPQVPGQWTNSVQDNQQGPRIPQNVPDCKVSEMPFCLKSYLSLELDLKGSYTANWRDVGKSLKLTKEQLKGLEIVCQTPGDSPTESLFAILESQGSDEPSVKDLVMVLIENGRSDIIENWDWEVNKRKT